MQPETPTPARAARPAARVLWRGRHVRGSVDGYDLRAPLASGGEPIWAATVRGRFGCVQPVAIKAVHEVAVDDLGGREAFLDQAYVSSLIRHPNVAQVLDFGVDAELLYVVTEWVEGDTLQNLSRAARPFGGVPLDSTLRILADACAGLHAAHESRDACGGPQQPWYGDISPSSVLVSIHVRSSWQLDADPRACVTTYLSISAEVRRSRDRAEIERLWKPDWKAWFPDGPKDPTITLLELTVKRAEYWEQKGSKLRVLYEMARAVIGGKPADANLDPVKRI
jgi:serine/threonine protein kinase